MTDYGEQEYWADIDALAKELIEHDGTRGYELDEAVDHTKWIVYNAGNYAVIKYTKNEDAIFDELGSDAGECYSGASCFQQVVQWTASWAMMADVRQRAEELKREAAK